MILIPNNIIYDLPIYDNLIDTGQDPFIPLFAPDDLIYLQFYLEDCEMGNIYHDDIKLYDSSNTEIALLGNLPSQTINKNWLTVKFRPTDYSISEGCFYITYKKNCNFSLRPSSNTFMVTTNLNGTKKVVAYSTCFALGFDWSVFRLSFRVPFARFNPEYDLISEDYLNSDQVNIKQYAERGKFWQVRTAPMDEGAHDCITAMLLCNTLLIDNVEFYFSKKDYSLADWDKDGQNILSTAQFQLRKQNDAPINSNCQDCNEENYYYYG